MNVCGCCLCEATAALTRAVAHQSSITILRVRQSLAWRGAKCISHASDLRNLPFEKLAHLLITCTQTHTQDCSQNSTQTCTPQGLELELEVEEFVPK